MWILFFQRSEDGKGLWIWLIIILIPVLGRVAGWVLERLGGAQPGAAGQEAGDKQADDKQADDKQARAARRKERAQELERRGQEMWKRLLEGDTAPAKSEPEAKPAPPPVPARPAAPPGRDGHDWSELARAPLPHDELPSAGARPARERRLVPSRGSDSMPAIQELAQHTKSNVQALRSLQADEEASELGRVDYLQALRSRPGSEWGTDAGSGTDFVLPRDARGWRQAIVWSEIVGPPVALRDSESSHLPALR